MVTKIYPNILEHNNDSIELFECWIDYIKAEHYTKNQKEKLYTIAIVKNLEEFNKDIEEFIKNNPEFTVAWKYYPEKCYGIIGSTVVYEEKKIDET